MQISDADREIPTRGLTDNPETRFTEFQALFVDPNVGILGLNRRLMIGYFILPINGKIVVFNNIYIISLSFYN